MPLPLIPIGIGVAELTAIVGTAITGFFTWAIWKNGTDTVESLAMPLITAAQQDEPEKEENEFKNFASIVSTGLAVSVVYLGYQLMKKAVKSF